MHSKVKTGEVKLVPNNLDNCELYLPCEEKSMNLSFDHSGHERHGIIYGATTVVGKLRNALGFDGIDDYVNCGTLFDVTNKLTVMCWVKSLTGAFGNLVGKFETFSKRWHVFVYDSQNKIYWNIGGANYATSPSNVLLNSFHHIAMVYDGNLIGNENRLKGYIDGVQVSLSFTGTIPSVMPTIVGNVLVGRHSTTDYFKGSLSEIRVFSKALTEQEVITSFVQES